jgi:hypothetical protein
MESASGPKRRIFVNGAINMINRWCKKQKARSEGEEYRYPGRFHSSKSPGF